MEKLSLIDMTQEDDFLTSSPCGALIDQISPGLSHNPSANNNFESVTEGFDKDDCQEKLSKQVELVLKLSESPEQNQTKSGKYNLRKSLAWDSAFFTSEGVLDHEELAIVNSTFKKTEVRSLPMILEDTRKSSESTSTFDNDSWALENVEADLFNNVKASIQKSFGSGDKVSRLIKPSKKITSALVKVESSSNNKKKSPGLTEKQYKKTSKEATAVLAFDGKTNSKMLSKPTRVLPKATTTMPTKTIRIPGNSQQRNNTTRDISGTAVCQKSLTSLKKFNAGPSNINFKSSQSLKPSLNLVDNSGDKALKSSQDLTRMRSTSRTINHSSRSVTNKVPIRPSGAKIVRRDKNSHAISPNSIVNLSSTSSPSTSFDCVASGSSTSTIFGFKSVADPIEASLSPSLEGPLLGLKSGASSKDVEHSGPSNLNQQESRTNTKIGAKCFKPSGLKAPTPKIGYFDATKSITFNAKPSRPRQQPSVLKSTTGVCKIEGANRLKPRKIPQINKGIPSDSPKIQTTAPSQESSSPEHLPKHLGSNDSIGTSNAQLEMSTISKDFNSPKGHSSFKALEVIKVNNLESALPKPTRKELDSDMHPKHMEEPSISIDRSPSLGTKNSDTVSYPDSQEPDTQNSHHSDIPTIIGKENVFPA
ncbi:uncharacterized protein LOC141828472 [Curcuma longa]|uniref:uncharacterized protein LOC141828472 n=1 Tax=Curcuma longa TaxID=136217 RepID=UPI003D9DCEC3